MPYNLAILIPTFLRDNLLYKTIQSIVDNHTINCIILIADQGYVSEEKDITIDFYKSQIALEYYSIPFDSGLAIIKNILVQKALEKNIPYVFMGSDNLQFPSVQKIEQLFNLLDNNLISFGPIPFQDPFLAKTDTLLNLWDEEMKMYEHELANVEYLKRGYKVIFNTNYKFKSINTRTSDEYNSYIKRMRDYKKLSEQKLKCI